MWFTSLMQDTVSVLTTDNVGIPVYSFRQEKSKGQYLSALPDEITGLQQDESGYNSQEGLFLSALKGRGSVPTHRYEDTLTGRHLWTIDRLGFETELFSPKEKGRYNYEGKDFRVYPTRDSADGLIPIYQAFNPHTGSIEWSDTRKDFSKGFQDVSIAWYAEPFPIDSSHF
jgi:hypothetical protein